MQKRIEKEKKKSSKIAYELVAGTLAEASGVETVVGVGFGAGICFAASVTMPSICVSSWVGTSLM